jgi:hypothetical protein
MTRKTRRVAHETFELAIERWLACDRRYAGHLASQTTFPPRIDTRNTALACAQGSRNIVKPITQARHDAHARYNHA